MDESRTTDGKLEALEAMREEAMTDEKKREGGGEALAGRLARGGETSEEARAKTVEVVACALRAGVRDEEEGDGDGGVEEDARVGVGGVGARVVDVFERRVREGGGGGGGRGGGGDGEERFGGGWRERGGRKCGAGAEASVE